MSNFQEQQQLKNEGFLRQLITNANQHSKKLTIIDIIIYVVLMIGLTAVMIIYPHIAQYIVESMGYVTTAYVVTRLSYSAKSAIENFGKIRNSMKTQGVAAIVEEVANQEETLG